MELDRYAIWLHDYGSQFGFRLAMSAPDRVTGLIIQNGDIYDEFGPKYDGLRRLWDNPGPDARRAFAEHVSLDGFRDEFAGELPEEVADRISPDLWTLHWGLMSTPERLANLIRLLEDQPSTLEWLPRERGYLREHKPHTLIVWARTTATRPRAQRGRTTVTTQTRSYTCSAAVTGCSRPTWTRWFRSRGTSSTDSGDDGAYVECVSGHGDVRRVDRSARRLSC